MLDWLGKLLGLPHEFLAAGPDGKLGRGGGVIQSTASEATLVALLAARCRAMAGRPAEDALRLVAYSSDQVRIRFRIRIRQPRHGRVVRRGRAAPGRLQLGPGAARVSRTRHDQAC